MDGETVEGIKACLPQALINGSSEQRTADGERIKSQKRIKRQNDGMVGILDF